MLAIEIGDKLFSSDRRWIEITKIDYGSDPLQTYNLLSISGTKNYFANGLLVYEEHPQNCIKNFYHSKNLC